MVHCRQHRKIWYKYMVDIIVAHIVPAIDKSDLGQVLGRERPRSR